MKTEHEIQREFVKWMRQTHPDYWIFAVPNGGKRNLITAGKLKAEGVSAGVPDIFIPRLKMFIEMKTDRGRLSPEQKLWLDYLAKSGYVTTVSRARDIESLKSHITKVIADYNNKI